MNHRVVAASALILIASATSAQAQKLEARTAAQLKRDFSEAVTTGGIVSEIRARIVKRQVLFDITVVPNRSKTPWMALLNMTPEQLEQAKKRYGADGYTVGPQTTITANGKKYVSVIWLKTGKSKPTLIRPAVETPETGKEVQHLSAVDAAIRKFVVDHNVAGATIAIGREGKVVYDRGFGWADLKTRRDMQPHTPMRVAGVSKLITAIATMQLVEEGRLKFDQKIMPLLKDAGIKGADRPKDRRWNLLEVQHLLQHTGGWNPAVTADPMFQTAAVSQAMLLRQPANLREVIQYQLDQRMNFAPASKYAHSEFGYSLLGRVVELASDQTYRRLVTDSVLKPAGMKWTQPGRTRVSDRGRGEARYHMQSERKGAAFWSAAVSRVRTKGKTVTPPDIVAAPDGAFDVETMLASSGWLSTAGDLCRLMLALDLDEDPLLGSETKDRMTQPSKPMKGKDRWYGCGIWVSQSAGAGAVKANRLWHGGVMAGSSAIVVKRADGVVWAAVFNTDFDPSGKPIAQAIESKLDAVLNGLKWSD